MHISDMKMVANQAISQVTAIGDISGLEILKQTHLGKKSAIALSLKALKGIPNEEKAAFASAVNQAKEKIEHAIEKRRAQLLAYATAIRLTQESIDVSLPGRGISTGGLHPLNRSLERIQGCFASLGFEVADGPELETSLNNFTALNMPDNHPARSMHDTFYIEGDKNVQLRTHTSPIQVRYMREHIQKHAHLDSMPEIRIIAPGRTYRVDSDATHSPMFHQLEGLWIGSEISFSNLKWVIQEFLKSFFESDDLKTRFRPSFFPFTEPSAEIDVAFFSGSLEGKWLEVGGCGMVHPNVLSMGGVDSEKNAGFAFGMGIDRLTMLRYGINDLRTVYENDLRFLKQFN